MIEINESKCISCHKCINVCPFLVLGKNEDDKPEVINEKGCIKCMHCAATCPVDAVTYDGKEMITTPEFSSELEKQVLTRRSYRNFKNEPIDEKVIEEVLTTASWAPSAKNQHPTKWIVINSPDTIKEMMDIILEHVKETGISPEVVSQYENGNNVVMGTAPTLLIAHADQGVVNPIGDTYIAMTTIELLLQSKGIGTCWAGYLTRFLNGIPKLKALLPEIPENNIFYASFMMGYPQNEEYVHVPERLNRPDITWVKKK